MKGLSIKKLAAVAVGGALIGSALAPVVSAAVTSNIDTLEKSNVVNPATGVPVVNVVAGSGAAHSDLVWAGNIATKVAQLATVESAVTCGGGADGGTTCEPTGVTVDVTVGGDVTYDTTTSKTYKGNQYPLNSDNSVPTATAQDPLIVNLGSSQLNFLTNETRNYRYNGSTYNIVVKEYVGIKADAKMDLKSTAVEDLVVYMNTSGDFNYWVDLGNGIPADSTTASGKDTKFTDGDDDQIKIPFLGEEYVVQEVDYTSGSTYKVKLIKESDKSTYYEGQEVTGLEGRGNYDGEELSVLIDKVTQSGAATTTYNVRYKLLDAEGNVVDNRELGSGIYLNENFTDSAGEYALDTVIYVSTAGIESTTSKGYITATVGKSVVDVADNKVFPYDSTDTDSTDDYWIASLTFGTDTSPDVNALTAITIKNSVKKWDDTNPLYASTGALTTAGQASDGTAIFLEGNNTSDLGYDFVRLQFDGFNVDQSVTTFKLGKGACETTEGTTAGCLIYTDNAGEEREVPFYIELQLTESVQGTFMIDNQQFYYRCNRTDENVLVGEGNLLNGIPVRWNAEDTNLMTDFGLKDLNDSISTVDLNGMTYTEYGDGGGQKPGKVYLGADGNCQFSNTQWDNYTESGESTNAYILKMNGNRPYYDTIFYDDDNQTLGKAQGYEEIDVTNTSLNDTYKYVFYAKDESNNKAFLLLDASTNFTNEFTSIDAWFLGTDIGEQDALCARANTTAYGATCTYEDTRPELEHYVPDTVNIGTDPSDTDYIVAQFGFDTNKAGPDVNAYIAGDGKLISFPNSDRTGYTWQVDFNKLSGWGLRSDTQGTYASSTWTDYGAKVEVVTTDSAGDYLKIVTPENQVYLKYAVLKEGTATTASGGTSFTGLGEGQTGEEGSTKVTVDAIGVPACDCPAGGGAVPSPASAVQIVPVGQLVYTDTPEPAGANVIVGGWMVNKLVTQGTSLGAGEGTLGEALTATGDRVVQLLDNGDIVVAGYTANDTKNAATDLINALEALA